MGKPHGFTRVWPLNGMLKNLRAELAHGNRVSLEALLPRIRQQFEEWRGRNEVDISQTVGSKRRPPPGWPPHPGVEVTAKSELS
jgi:hypothetical protein